MASIEEIDKAIAAHGMWKARLKAAIETAKLDTSVETVRQDNQCAFGKWLYGPTLTPVDKTSKHYVIGGSERGELSTAPHHKMTEIPHVNPHASIGNPEVEPGCPPSRA